MTSERNGSLGDLALGPRGPRGVRAVFKRSVMLDGDLFPRV